MATDLEASEVPLPPPPPTVKRTTSMIPAMKGSSIHTLGQGKIGKINAKYPFSISSSNTTKKQSTNNDQQTTSIAISGNNNSSNGNTMAAAVGSSSGVVGSSANEVIVSRYSSSCSGSGQSSGEHDNNASNSSGNANGESQKQDHQHQHQLTNNNNDDDDDDAPPVVGGKSKNNNFNALLSKFGGAKKHHQPQQQSSQQVVVSNNAANNNIPSPKKVDNVHQPQQLSALVSKFGGGKKQQQQHQQQQSSQQNQNVSDDSNPSDVVDAQQTPPAVAAAAPQSSSAEDSSQSGPITINNDKNPSSESEEGMNDNNYGNNTTAATTTANKKIAAAAAAASGSTPLMNKKKIASFLKPTNKSKPSPPEPPLQTPQSRPPPPSSSNNNDNNAPSVRSYKNQPSKKYNNSNSGRGGGSSSSSSGIISSSKRYSFGVGSIAKQQEQLKKKLSSPRNNHNNNMQLGPQQSQNRSSRPKAGGQRSVSTGSAKSSKLKSKLPQQQQQQQHHQKMNHRPSKSTDGGSGSGPNISTSIDSGSSPRNNNGNYNNNNNNNNMIQRKSQQRLVLEQVASQYFLNDGNNSNSGSGSGSGSGRRCGNAKYVGAMDYGEDNGSGRGEKGNGSQQHFLGNIDESRPSGAPVLGLSANNGVDGANVVDRIALLSFLGGDNDNGGGGGGGGYGNNNEVGSSSAPTDAATPSAENNGKKSTTAEQQQAQQHVIQQETDIDRILEMASDHLSLGKNDLALLAYRRAMKCAFAEVLSVKQKLVEVNKKQQQQQKQKQQQQGNYSSTSAAENELIKKQEKQFELSLLQVASRVADIHNNMGVVHEMNRHYQKAKQSYSDALEVYHNTCKRFEEKGDPDVDRTKKNVERMALACHSEGGRKSLHEKARKIAKSVERERHFSQRKLLLNEAIFTLKRALELESETIGGTHPVAASTLVQIGKYHYENRSYDDAEGCIRKSITILRNALGPLHPQVGKTTLLLASIYERHGLNGIAPRGESKEDVELELYVDALEPLKATLGEVHGEVGYLYVKIGYLYGKKGDVSLSLLAYKAALKAYGEPSPASVYNPEVVSIWVRVAEHLTTLKSWDEAVVAGRRALFLLRRCKNTLFRDVKLLSSNHSGSATISISGASIASQQPPAPKPTNGSSKKSPIQISSDTYHDSIFTTIQCLGQAHASLSNYLLARDACEESLQLAWEMALSSIISSAVTAEEAKLAAHSSVVRVIHALKRLGKVHLLERHYAPALECFLPALALLRSSPETEGTLDCASVLGSLGFLYLKLKRYTESSNFLRECSRLYTMNGVSTNDRETRKIQAWLQMAESREEEDRAMPPSFLEIPTIVFHDENSDSRYGSV